MKQTALQNNEDEKKKPNKYRQDCFQMKEEKSSFKSFF